MVKFIRNNHNIYDKIFYFDLIIDKLDEAYDAEHEKQTILKRKESLN